MECINVYLASSRFVNYRYEGNLPKEVFPILERLVTAHGGKFSKKKTFYSTLVRRAGPFITALREAGFDVHMDPRLDPGHTHSHEE
jgi:hypothetical protein